MLQSPDFFLRLLHPLCTYPTLTFALKSNQCLTGAEEEFNDSWRSSVPTRTESTAKIYGEQSGITKKLPLCQFYNKS